MKQYPWNDWEAHSSYDAARLWDIERVCGLASVRIHGMIVARYKVLLSPLIQTPGQCAKKLIYLQMALAAGLLSLLRSVKLLKGSTPLTCASIPGSRAVH